MFAVHAAIKLEPPKIASEAQLNHGKNLRYECDVYKILSV